VVFPVDVRRRENRDGERRWGTETAQWKLPSRTAAASILNRMQSAAGSAVFIAGRIIYSKKQALHAFFAMRTRAQE
jgi:hypothetical protein